MRLTADDLRSHAYSRNPFPIWERLRQDQPLFYDAPSGRWVLSRYHDVAAVLTDSATYSTRTYSERFRPILGTTFSELDGAAHRQRRGIVAPPFSGRGLERSRELIAGCARAALGGLAGSRRAELLSQLARPFALTVIASMMGIRSDDHPALFAAAGRMGVGLDGSEPGVSDGAAARVEATAIFAPAVAQRRATPTDDVVSCVATAQLDQCPLSDEEISSLLCLVLLAGGPTVELALANFWADILSDRDLLRALRDQPAKLDAAYLEAVRRDGPMVYEDRLVMRDVEWHGQTVPQGQVVMICLGAANTDPTVFADADHFVPDRYDTTEKPAPGEQEPRRPVPRPLSFGLGAHFCLGYQLARLEARIGTELMLNELPGLRLEAGERPQPTISCVDRELHPSNIRVVDEICAAF
jgi:cytochrome P450